MANIFGYCVLFAILSVYCVVPACNNDAETIKAREIDSTSFHAAVQRSPICNTILPNERLNCLPLRNITKDQCEKLSCCWDAGASGNQPKCFFSPSSSRYNVSEIKRTSSTIEGSLTGVSFSGFPNDVAKAELKVTFCNENVLRFRVVDSRNARFEVPLPLSYAFCTASYDQSMSYDVRLFYNGTFDVRRKHSDSTLFSTNLSQLVFSDQFLQISSSVPSSYIYGLGDHLTPLRKSTNWTKYTFFNRDQIPEENMNLYSSFPFYMVVEEDGNSHGVFLFNSNAMDAILQPAPSITFRTVGGILDLFVFMGPTPDEVVQQFTQLIGLPALPPYWSLGFHLCRLGYFTVNKTMEVVKRTVDAGIPFDTQWNDIDYMDRYNDFTYDTKNFKGLPDFVKSLHAIGMHYAMIIDPGISSAEPKGTYPPFDEGLKLDIFVKNASGQLLQTKVWNKVSSVFPDFTNPVAQVYWQVQIEKFHTVMAFDGVWLDMNEPTNFLDGSFVGCPNSSSLENPPYVPGSDPLRTKTICMTAQHKLGPHYNIHNVYGTFQTIATNEAMVKIRQERPFVLTRAGFPGIGRYAAMWNGDVISIWEHMQKSIPSLIGYSMAGIPFVGSDICGFNNDTSVELCARWFALGAFYPFSRNHNSDENIEQDPVALGPVVVAAAKSALSVRYFLLPYLYTLLYHSHTTGSTVMRPLFFEYPRDKTSCNVDRQFLWGPALMVIPALEPGISYVNAYIPPDVWYDFYSGLRYKSNGQRYTLSAPLDKINLIVRSGFIIPGQDVSQTTTKSRENNFKLLVALDGKGEAHGELFWDNGTSLDVIANKAYNLIGFSAAKNHLSSTLHVIGYPINMLLGEIKIFGVLHKPYTVLINKLPVDYAYNTSSQVLLVANFTARLLKPLVLEW